jgi:hypothetical protein
MQLNISDDELIRDPSDADIERAIRSLVVKVSLDFGDDLHDESFALLLATDRKGDFIQATKLGEGNYSVGYRIASSGRAYRRWNLPVETVIALFKNFRRGESCLEYGFIWCDHTEWAGELAQRPPGWDDEVEEQLEEEACITVGDVADMMMDMRERNPDLADLLEQGMDDPDAPGNQGAVLTRTISLAWMRVTTGEDALSDLKRTASQWNSLSEKKRRSWRKEWAQAMRSLNRLARDREQWNDDLELEAKWVELRGAFQDALPTIRRLELLKPPVALTDSKEKR